MVILFLIYLVIFIAGCTIPIRFISVLLNGLKPLRPENNILRALILVSDVGGILCLPVTYIYIYYPKRESVFVAGWTYFWVFVIIASIAAYFIASYRLRALPLLKEFLLNLILGLGLAACLSIGYELAVGLESRFHFVIFSLPVIFLLSIALMKRHLIVFNRLPPASNFLSFWRKDKSARVASTPYSFKKSNFREEAAAWALTKPLPGHLGIFLLFGFLIIGVCVLIGQLLG